MTEKRDYYEILGVSIDAEGQEIKSRYRKLAIRYHPDKNPGDKEAEEKFKEAAEAYEVLQDPRKRKIYNQYGHQGLEGSGFSGFGGFEDIFSSFGDIFEDFFGFSSDNRRSHSRNRAQRGHDLRYDLTLDFMDAAFGMETEIDLEKSETCSRCGGSCCEPDTHPETCSHCRGSGQVSRSQGFFTLRSTCPTCNGRGQSITTPCTECDGRGQVIVKKKVSLKIPGGVDNGSRLRLTSEGEAGVNGGPPGDLYVFINVKEHNFFTRNETDVICKIPISFVQATLGDKIKVPTLNSEKTLSIPKGTQFGDIFRFQDEGIPSLRGNHRGDQIIQVEVKTPTGISKKQESLLKEFARLESDKFKNKLKDMFKGKAS